MMSAAPINAEAQRQPDTRAVEVFSQRRADLRPDGTARVHDQRDHNVHIAFNGMGERAVAGRDDDFKEVGSTATWVGTPSRYTIAGMRM